MARRRETSPAPTPTPTPGAGSLAALVGLGVVSALWALYQWTELVLVRQGGDAFCAISDTINCNAIWGSGFASSIHRLTGVPVAGWGVVWSLVAAAMPLWALTRKAAGRPAAAWVSGTRITAGVGVLAVVVLAGVALAAGALCLGCLGTYVLTALYAGVALIGWRRVGLPEAGRGVARAAGLTAVAFLALLWPGLATPGDPADVSRAAVSDLARGEAPAREAPAPAPDRPSEDAVLGGGRGTGDEAKDRMLLDLVRGLPHDVAQSLANQLVMFKYAPEGAQGEPRAMAGPAGAPVRIVEWTDAQCPHCARLHADLHELRDQLPEGVVAIVPRHFPLDGTCNPQIGRTKDGLSCLAAKAQICLEGTGEVFRYAGKLFEQMGRLDEERVYALAEPFMGREALEACVESPATQAALEQDVSLAIGYGIRGTPMVVVGRRQVPPDPALLYALVLSEANPDHPAFADLPAPRAELGAGR